MFLHHFTQFRPPLELTQSFFNYLKSCFDRYFELQFWVRTALQVYFERSCAFSLDLTSWSSFHSNFIFVFCYLELFRTLLKITWNCSQSGLIHLFRPWQFWPMIDLIYLKDKDLDFYQGSYLFHLNFQTQMKHCFYS